MQRMQLDERVVGCRRVLVAKLLEVELAKIAVDAVLVAAAALCREVLLTHFGAAEVREAQADDVKRVRDAPLVVFLVLLVEVVADGDLVIEQRHVSVQRFLVELLLVESPAELVQGQLVVFRALALAMIAA